MATRSRSLTCCDSTRRGLQPESSRRSLDHRNPAFVELRLHRRHRTVQVDSPAGIADDERRQTQPPRVERRVAHAIVIGQPGKKDTSQPALLQITRQAGRRRAVVLKECRIGIDLRAEPLAQNQLRLRQLQLRDETPRPASPARSGPAIASARRSSAQSVSKGFLPGCARRKRRVTGGMPILREDDVLEQRRDAMNRPRLPHRRPPRPAPRRGRSRSAHR